MFVIFCVFFYILAQGSLRQHCRPLFRAKSSDSIWLIASTFVCSLRLALLRSSSSGFQIPSRSVFIHLLFLVLCFAGMHVRVFLIYLDSPGSEQQLAPFFGPFRKTSKHFLQIFRKTLKTDELFQFPAHPRPPRPISSRVCSGHKMTRANVVGPVCNKELRKSEIFFFSETN